MLSKVVRTFNGDYAKGIGAAGNVHLVVVCQRADIALGMSVSAKIAPLILVLLEFPFSPTSVRALFFQHGRMVQRCGSGSLAVAVVLRHSFQVETSSRIIGSSSVLVGKCKGRERFFYQTDTLPIRSSRISPWQQVVNRELVSVSLIGGKNAYAILHLANEKAVKQCAINECRLSLVSGRAVIVTAASNHLCWDYVMRYFAPQYGQHEDAATGSANAMLAGYWQQALIKLQVSGRQLSVSGGEFSVVAKGKQQQVIGRAEEITLEDSMACKVERALAPLGGD